MFFCQTKGINTIQKIMYPHRKVIGLLFPYISWMFLERIICQGFPALTVLPRSSEIYRDIKYVNGLLYLVILQIYANLYICIPFLTHTRAYLDNITFRRRRIAPDICGVTLYSCRHHIFFPVCIINWFLKRVLFQITRKTLFRVQGPLILARDY